MSVRIQNAFGIVSSDVPVGNLLWVDAVNGVDALATRGRMTIPFNTLAAAKNAAVVGDTIVVLPGSYATSEQLAKPGVNWHFLPGSTIAPDTGLPNALFEVGSGMNFTVTGHGYFDLGAVSKHVVYVSSGGAGSEICFEAYRIWAGKTAIKIAGDAMVVVKADQIVADEESGIEISAGVVTVTVRQIESVQLHGVKCTGGTLELDAGLIKGVVSTTMVNGIWISGGTARIRAVEIYSEGANAVYYSSGGSLTIQNARLVSNYNNSAGYAVYAAGGSSGITLHNCILLAKGTNANESIHAFSSFTVQFHGYCTANKTKTSNILVPSLTDVGGFRYGSAIT